MITPGWSWDGRYHWIRLKDEAAKDWARRPASELRTELQRLEQRELSKLLGRSGKWSAP